MSKEDLFLHLAAITKAFDEGADLDALADTERRILGQKIIGAFAALNGLAVELEQAGSRTDRGRAETGF